MIKNVSVLPPFKSLFPFPPRRVCEGKGQGEGQEQTDASVE